MNMMSNIKIQFYARVQKNNLDIDYKGQNDKDFMYKALSNYDTNQRLHVMQYDMHHLTF